MSALFTEILISLCRGSDWGGGVSVDSSFNLFLSTKHIPLLRTFFEVTGFLYSEQEELFGIVLFTES